MLRRPKKKKITLTKEQRDAMASFEKLKKQLDELPKFSKSNIAIPKKFPAGSTPPGRETPQYPSLSTGKDSTKLTETLQYTGSKIKGVGTMHKSNSIPVFSDEEAVDIATMRRN